MQIARFLRPECVRLGLSNGHMDEIDPEKDRARELRRLKNEVVEELTDLFMVTGQIRNRNKFSEDFHNREKKATTYIADGIAIPHVRSLQPRGLVFIFARSKEGVWYDSPDGELAHLFFGLTAPSYDDKVYLQMYQWVARIHRENDWLRETLLAAADEHEIISILQQLR